MATSRTSRAAGVLARLLAEASPDVQWTDGQLIRAFVERKCPAAFGELVLRHGPMVLGVCLRVLRHRQDAEDAFQATFLVLARKAGSVSHPNAVGNWLYGVALQTAVRARAITMKRRRRETVVPSVPETAIRLAGWDDVAEVLDEELGRLPSHYRAVLLLCDLEGRTRAYAARHLGCPEGTVSSRLSRARAMLAMRLSKRGVTLQTGAVALLVGQNATAVGVPAALGSLAAGSVLGGGASPVVTTLAEGVLKAMFIKKVITATLVVLALGIAAITGVSLAIGQTEGIGKPVAVKNVKQPAAEKPVEPAVIQEKEAFTAWGKEIGGLQAGLGFKAGEKRVYHHGETVKLVVRIRNVGKEAVKFEYLKQFLIEKPPTVADADGKTVRLSGITRFGSHIPMEVSLAPGKEVELYEWTPDLKPASEKDDEKPNHSTLYGTGKFQIQYEQVIGKSSSGGFLKLDPVLSKLATGKLELEVKTAPQSDTDKIQGKWVPVACEVSGTPLTGKQLEDFQFYPSFDGKKYVVKVGTLRMEGTFELNSTSNPKTITLKRAGGTSNLGIYTFDGDQLRICIAETKTARPTEFKTKADSGHSLILFERVSRERVLRENEVRDAVDRFLKTALAGETEKARALAAPAVSDQQVARFKGLIKTLPLADLHVTTGSAPTSHGNNAGRALVVTDEVEVTHGRRKTNGRIVLTLLKDDERLKTKGWLIWDIDLKDDADVAKEVKNFLDLYPLPKKVKAVEPDK